MTVKTNKEQFDDECPMCDGELYRVEVNKEIVGKCYRYYCKKCNYEYDGVTQ